jgi:hypothetical protein
VTGRAAALTLLLLAAAACRNSETVTAGPSTPPDPTATFTRVQREIFTPSCALSGCHAGTSPQLGMVLEAGKAYGSLVGALSVETSLLRVSPWLPNDSYLVVKLRGDATILGSRMPLGGAALPPERLALVVDWVRRGAPND